mmetsp:Transcript_54724/g.108910  ORF Transcript_54724/g.108910 Transcript_54724/m.108910 type:complete len:278 (-) Transcript_54724:261-1094(-)
MKDGLGNVFLKRSKASSSFKILIVSLMAKISSARVLHLSAHSASLVAQPFSSSARNFLSSANVFAVSSKSSFISTMSRPTCPTRSSLDSMAAVFASTSFFFAAIKALKFLIASASAAVMSASVASIVSFICLRIPTICPLCGAYPWPCERKDVSISLSSDDMSASIVILCNAAVAAAFCKKLPAVPASIAAVAFTSAAMFVFRSDDSFAKALASFSRREVAVAMVFFASATFFLCCSRSFSSCAFAASAAASALSTCGIFSSAAVMACVRSAVPVLQ